MILIADDNREMRETLKDILREFDPYFCECSNGNEVVELYRTHHPDWVLMDVMMPFIDGIAATRRIKDLFPDARILIVTNYNDPLLRHEAKQAGAVGFVLKDDLSVLATIMGQFS